MTVYDQGVQPRAVRTASIATALMLAFAALCLVPRADAAGGASSHDAVLLAVHRLDRSKRLSIHGQLRAWASQKVHLQVRRGKRWLTLKLVKLNAEGRFHFAVVVSTAKKTVMLRLVVDTKARTKAIWHRRLRLASITPQKHHAPKHHTTKAKGNGSSGEPSTAYPDMLRDYHLHILYWTPPGTTAIVPEVTEAISALEHNVQSALAAGEASNIFAIPGEYTGPKGPGDPRIASIEEVSASDPLAPASDVATCASGGPSCASRGQVEAEVETRSRQAGWGGGEHNLVLVYASRSLVVCMQSGCSPSSGTCGYHGFTSSGQAYGIIALSGGTASCGGGPNAIVNYGGYAIELTGHEQNEAVVDPVGLGTEIADPCEGQFTPNVINGVPYELPELMLHGSCAAAAGAP